MSVLLIAEHNNKEVKPFTFNAISAASQINEIVHVLVIGSSSDEVSKSISQVPNVKKVSSDNTFVISLTCETSSKAATLGIKFFPKVLAEQIICE